MAITSIIKKIASFPEAIDNNSLDVVNRFPTQGLPVHTPESLIRFEGFFSGPIAATPSEQPHYSPTITQSQNPFPPTKTRLKTSLSMPT